MEKNFLLFLLCFINSNTPQYSIIFSFTLFLFLKWCFSFTYYLNFILHKRRLDTLCLTDAWLGSGNELYFWNLHDPPSQHQV